MKIEKTCPEVTYALTLGQKDFDILLDIIGCTSDSKIEELVGHNNYKGWTYELFKVLDGEIG